MALSEKAFLDDLTRVINPVKSEILNTLELSISREQFNYVRGKILDSLGTYGLEARLKELLKQHDVIGHQ